MLGALSLVVLAVALPATILSVALPTLVLGTRGADAADLQWLCPRTRAALAAGVLPAGCSATVRPQSPRIALLIYAGGSVLAATATNPGMFIAAQAVLGSAPRSRSRRRCPVFRRLDRLDRTAGSRTRRRARAPPARR